MYTIVKVGVTESQLQTLMQGHKIFLEKSQFKGNVALPLTKSQAMLIASATRGINLKLSSRQISALQNGEGFVQDMVPIAREGVDKGLDFLQSKIPTHKLGAFKGIGDAALDVGRHFSGKLLDKIGSLFGGAAGRRAIDAQLGAGWFDEYLLPSVQTAANIALPLMQRGRGGRGGARVEYHKAIDKQMGEGWFSDYLLPGVETAAKIATPFIRGGGFHGKAPMTGEGWFSDYLLPGVETAARIATPLIQGRGWTPMNKKKPSSGAGLVL